jgi:hypothetical protein
MLVDERKMDAQSAGFLTVEASGGLGFHILGAAARLGFRGLALVNRESERSTLSQHTGEVIIDTAEGAALAEAVKSPVESGFFFVTAALTEARPLEVSETKSLLRWRQELATKMRRGVLILHESEDEKIWHDWHQNYPEDWIFLTPQLVGLRDASFLDHWVQLTEQSPGTLHLRNPKPESPPRRILFASDLAGLLTHLLMTQKKSSDFANPLCIPPSHLGLLELLREFCEVFCPDLPLLERWAARLSSSSPWPAREETHISLSDAQKARVESPNHSALELFPTRLTPAKRFLESTHASLKRYPEWKTHFPPGRAL